MATWMKMTLSFLVGLVLTILPLPAVIQWMRPQWVLLLVFFWSLMRPQLMPLIAAFLLGLLVDLLTGTLLGQHALVYVVAAYLGLRWRRQIIAFPMLQMVGVVAVFTLCNLLVQYWALNLTGVATFRWLYWLPIVTNSLIWPWMYHLLRDARDFIHV